ncbi:hypothetical protein [Streptomyces formicae]|uniref:Secreted protein n=1 Tax=Streptomyces formicae TaxID=1616117 RepID=A0ABY3WML7_9ACTN|nr:hypothetical protein [Streptomyces formicae]UNM13864.1 hypothetical protein J4032_22490 [Streptomyces formicae]
MNMSRLRKAAVAVGAALVAGTTTASTAVASEASSGPSPQSSCYIAHDSGFYRADALHCAPRAGAGVHLDPPDYQVPEGYLNGTVHPFGCWSKLSAHDGGNDIWYHTYVDEWVHGYGIGWAKSTDVYTGTHPYPGLPECPR